MIAGNKYLTAIDDDTVIWRYLSFASFCSILKTNTLFFRRLDRYPDQLEAVLYQSTVNMYQEHRSKLPGGTRKESKRWASRIATDYKIAARYILSNSWTISNHEDYALWRVYLDGCKEGVAIRSTGGKLKESLNGNNYKISLGKVDYDEPKGNWKDMNIYRVATSKKRPYSYENEYRALIFGQHQYNTNDGTRPKPKFSIGVEVPVDLKVLVHQIYVSPFAGKWFFKIVKAMVFEYLDRFEGRDILHSTIKEKRND